MLLKLPDWRTFAVIDLSQGGGGHYMSFYMWYLLEINAIHHFWYLSGVPQWWPLWVQQPLSPSSLLCPIQTPHIDYHRLGVCTVPVCHGLDGSHTTVPVSLLCPIQTPHIDYHRLGVCTVPVCHGLDGSHTTVPVPMPFWSHFSHLDGWWMGWSRSIQDCQCVIDLMNEDSSSDDKEH